MPTTSAGASDGRRGQPHSGALLDVRVRLLTYGVAALLALLALACGSEEKVTPAPPPTATPSIDPTARLISDEELANMTLAQTDLGVAYELYVLQEDSGISTVAQRAEQACNPRTESDALSRFGWERGYQRFFLPTFAGAETMAIGSYVDVYRDAANASGKMKYDPASAREDTRSDRGCHGVVIEGVEEFAVPQLGDQAWGVRQRFSLGGVRGAFTSVSFRYGRVVATVGLTRLSFGDAAGEVIALAELLDARIGPMLQPPLS
jgi:hypothetical protein